MDLRDVRTCLVMACVVLGGAGCSGGEPCGHRVGGWELEVAVDGRPLEVVCRAGRSCIAGRPGQLYQVRLRNPTQQTVGVMLTVDGLSPHSRERTEVVPFRRGMILQPGAVGTWRGWRLNQDEVEAFVFDRVEDSLATRVGTIPQIGLIEAAVYPRDDQKVLYAHRSMSRLTGRVPQRLGTGAGPRLRDPVRYYLGSFFPEDPERPAARLALRYDAAEALCARGEAAFCGR